MFLGFWGLLVISVFVVCTFLGLAILFWVCLCFGIPVFGFLGLGLGFGFVGFDCGYVLVFCSLWGWWTMEVL